MSTSREYGTRSFNKRNFDVVIIKKKKPAVQSGPTLSEASPVQTLETQSFGTEIDLGTPYDVNQSLDEENALPPPSHQPEQNTLNTNDELDYLEQNDVQEDQDLYGEETTDDDADVLAVNDPDADITKQSIEVHFQESPRSHQKHKHRLSQDEDTPQKKTKTAAEEHNEALLSDPRMRDSTVLNPEFLKTYYEESRLHFLSRWKAELKARFQNLTSSQQKDKPKFSLKTRRHILHIDFDCFFAAVSSRSRSDLDGKPVAVAHSRGPSSEIASCNYAARDFGIHNGMWMKEAIKICPQLNVLPYDFPAYEAASNEFYYAIIALDARAIQSVSVDEALVDITNLCTNENSLVEEENDQVDEIATLIRKDIKTRTGCAVSVGAGSNVLLAKLALRKAKPAGQYHLVPTEVSTFLAPLKIKDLPGFGHNTCKKIEEELKCQVVGDLRQQTKERLKKVLGEKTGQKLWEFARGIDNTEVGEVTVRKSVSAEVNWGVRFETQKQSEDFISNLAGELHNRLAVQKLKGMNLTLKLMQRRADAPLEPPKHMGHGSCDTHNKTTVLGVASNNPQLLAREAVSLLRAMKCPCAEMRGLALMMTKLKPVEEDEQASQKRLSFKTRPAPSTKPVPPTAIATIMKPPEIPTKTPVSKPPILDFTPTMTQFVVPSQIDQSVLESLPQDIQERISLAQAKKQAQQPKAEIVVQSKPVPGPSRDYSVIPSSSQLDPEVLASLPADIKAEILAEYASAKGGQTLLPQSPRKTRIIASPTKKRAYNSPSKKRSIGGAGFFVGQGSITSFRTRLDRDTHGTNSANKPGPSSPDDLGLDKDVLAELPEDIRKEVIAQARQDRERQRAREAEKQRLIDLKNNSRGLQLQKRLKLPARPRKPLLQGSTEIDDVRNLIVNWFNSCRKDGPHGDDVSDIILWLKKVVLGEMNMEKAVMVVKWCEWVVGEGEGDGEWKGVVKEMKEGVRSAAMERGVRMLHI